MLPMKHILCPIDFSDFSRRAFDRAVEIAELSGAGVTAVHVSSAPAVEVVPVLGAEALPSAVIDRATLTAQLTAFLGLPRPSDAAIRIVITEAADVPREILAQARRLDAELIVMGTHGRSGFQRLLLGSVAETVLRTATVPVLTVPGAAPDAAGWPAPASRIVCGVDFSECSVGGLEYAAALAEWSGAALTVVHVVEIPQIAADPIGGVVLDTSNLHESLVRDGARHLNELVAARVGSRCPVKEMVTKGAPAAGILSVAAAERAGLIVLGIRARTVVDRLVFGSTTQAVVRQAPCAVLTVRNAARHREEPGHELRHADSVSR